MPPSAKSRQGNTARGAADEHALLSRLGTLSGNDEERKSSGVGIEAYSGVTDPARLEPMRGTEEVESEEPGIGVDDPELDRGRPGEHTFAERLQI